jgi:cell division protein FtsI (penicillin-binding protein 3)
MAFIGVLFSISLVLIAAKSVHLQVFQGPWLSREAADQYEKSFEILGKRGTIYDANQTEMAVSIDVTSIGAYPGQIKKPAQTAKALAKVLDTNPSQLMAKLNSKKSFVWVKRQVTPREKSAVVALRVKGLDFIPEHNRVYPNKSLAAQTIGFAGIDGHGLEGVEFYYDAYLQGESHKLKVIKDALGRGFESNGNMPDTGGHNLILTIDKTIQYIAERALSKAVIDYKAKAGFAVVMAPKTGAVLAMAHYPLFNPNTFRSFDKQNWRNRVITDPFEPGSTLKVFTAAAALESKKVTAGSKFFCENGEYRVGRETVHDTRPHKWMTLSEIIKYSSNIGAAKIVQKIGAKTLYKTLTDFGFGVKTQIDCPGETSGNLSHYKQWSPIDEAAIAFGQGVSVSAMQLTAAVSAIANDGVLMKPHIVQVITNQIGRPVINRSPATVRRVVSIKTARAVNRMMQLVVEKGGTGNSAAIEGFRVAGKTGTAQKTNNSGIYEKDKYVSSFVGFVPADNPELTILVVVDEPQGEYYGSVVAAPAFKTIATESLSYLTIPSKNKKGRLTAKLKSGANA